MFSQYDRQQTFYFSISLSFKIFCATEVELVKLKGVKGLDHKFKLIHLILLDKSVMSKAFCICHIRIMCE